ncbi:MAG: hypothetical protein PUD63_12225 [Clostridia bacterium]|nr:hypothetical protein [Clostridia bacterium]
MSKYLDNNGLLYLWQKIKAKLALKVDAVEGKGLSTNDFTTAEKTKLAGIATGANKYTHPSYTSASSGLYKITVDNQGHVTEVVAVAKADITGLGIPGQDTKYTLPTASATTLGGIKIGTNLTIDGNGVVSATNTVYTHPGHTAAPSGLYKVTVDELGHVTAVTAVTKSDITALGIPAQDTKYTLPTASGSVLGGIKIGTNLSIDANGVVSSTDTKYSAVTTSANGLMTATDKAKLDKFGEASTYALKTDISNAYVYKGSVATVSDLPSTGQKNGHVYNVEATGMNYAWDGTAWDALGEIFTIDAISNSDIDTVVAS